MKASEIVAAFQGYLAAHDGYIPNTSGEVWTREKQDKATAQTVKSYGAQWIGHHVEDCSGAFVRAYKAAGLSIYHGSNRIARVYVEKLLPISEAKPGMAAFKKRHPGAQYYDLPSEYKPGGKYYNGDLNDYYHIGLVDVNPDYVINAQSTQTGVVRSKLAGWSAVGYLKTVQYEGGEEMPDENKRVVNADKVNLRAAPDTNAARVEYLNTGDIVTVGIEYGTGWDYVTHDKKSGYVKAEYLSPINGDLSPSEPPVIEDKDSITQWLCKAMEANERARNDLETEREALTMLQQLLTGAVG